MGNLLAGRAPVAAGGVQRIERTNDGVAAPEGAFWNVPLSAVLARSDAGVIWDLGAATRLAVAWIQADANDFYTLAVSSDGTSFTDVARVDPVDGDGLRGRSAYFPAGTVARYLRIGAGQGDGFYSIAEVQLFCERPARFPPVLRTEAAPMARTAPKPLWNDPTAARWQLVLAVLGLLLLLWRPEEALEVHPAPPSVPGRARKSLLGRIWAASVVLSLAIERVAGAIWTRIKAVFVRVGAAVTFLGLRPPELVTRTGPAAQVKLLRRIRDRLLLVLGALAACTYVNFFHFHFGAFMHDWEWTHYYVGAKYYDELGYDRLYECLAVADVEDGLRKRVELRRHTDLRTNLLVSSAEIAAQPERCKRHFSPARWQSFKQDVAYFRNRQSAKRWDDLQTDHGYNATPVWTVAGKLLTNLAPASTSQQWALALLDPAYLVATYAIIWWAFGWRTLCVALLVFATNFPSRFTWTGGSFLRWDWLFYLVAAVALLRKNRPMLAGASLAYATLLRVFPVFMFLGPLLGLGYFFYRHRRLEPRYMRFFAGAALATALLVPVSLVVGSGVEGYRAFVTNTVKHKETPLTNYMGLRTVVAYRPSEAGRFLKDDALTDPWKRWKEARIAAWKRAMPLYVVLAFGFVVLIGLATRHVEPWVATGLAITFIPIGVELTCYYYAFVIGVAVLWAERQEVGRWLLFLTAFTQFAAWAPLPGMATWLDEQYTYMSVATVVVFAAIVWGFRQPTAQDTLLITATPRPLEVRTHRRAATPGLAAEETSRP